MIMDRIKLTVKDWMLAFDDDGVNHRISRVNVYVILRMNF